MAVSVRFAVAVHVLVLLALERAGRTSAFIAGSVNTNPVVVRRILGRLRRAGLVAGRTGAGGGFTLLKAPGRLSLAEVYRAVEGQAVIARHAAPNPACPVGRNIGGVLDRVSRRAERAMLESLAGLTLVSVVSQVKTKAGAARRKETP
jgi:Rrf2 family protein